MIYRIYLDDIRTPIDKNWIVVRNYTEFVDKIIELGLENIDVISLDHDLGDTSLKEYHDNVAPNYILDYSHIYEKTGYDCAKWLVNHFYDNLSSENEKFCFPQIYIHSFNPVGAANIMGYINNFLLNENQKQSTRIVDISHT